MRLVIGSDHAGFPLKAAVVDHIKSLGHEVTCATYPMEHAICPVHFQAGAIDISTYAM